MKTLRTIVQIIMALVIISCSEDQKEVKKVDKAKEAITAKIIFKVGTVTLNGKDAKPQDFVNYGDVVETKKGSVCEILIGKKNIFMLKGDGKLIFKVSKNETGIVVEKGWFAAIIKNKRFIKQEFKISTPTLIAGVRGTSLCMKVENNKQVYFCTCNGTITLMDKNGEKKHDVTNAHHGAERYILNDDGKIEIKKSGMEFHDDTSIDNLAKKIDVKVDWTTPSK